MALQIAITNERTGTVNGYWRVTECSINAKDGSVLIVLSGYKDAQARQEYAPDDQRQWRAAGADYAAITSGVAIPVCYGIIKTTGPEFAGAVDV